MKQTSGSYIPSNKPIKEMSKDEIIAHFQWLDFKDALEHKLALCEYFLELVELATSKGQISQ